MDHEIQDPIATLYERMDEAGRLEARQHTTPPRRFRASEAGDCARLIWYRLRGQRPAPRNAVSNMYGMMGDVDHDVTRQLLNGYGVPVHGVTYGEDGAATEHMLVNKVFDVKRSDGRTVSIEVTSRADGEIDTPLGKVLCEIKGTGFWPYKYLAEAFKAGGLKAVLARIKDKHEKWYWQCQVTMALTGNKHCYLIVKDRSSGTLGFYNDDTGERSGITLDADPELFQEILQRFAFIQERLMSGEPPMPGYSASSNECSYCSFKYACHDAIKRQKLGIEPAILYPGPQFEDYHEPKVRDNDRPA